MTSILSLISGSFGRALVLGTLFPVTVATLLGLLFVVPFMPADVAVLAPLAALDPGWKIVLITLIVILLTGLLYNLNSSLIRLYEGYPWQHSWLGRRAIASQLLRRQWAESRRPLLKSLIATIRERDSADPAIGKLEVWRTRLGQRVVNEYPGPELVLPTRLGNVIRSFEEYPRSVYGISTVSVWPRLVGVLSKESLALLDDSKSSFDFMINASFLSGALSGSIFVAGLLVPARIHWPEWLFQVVLAGVASWLFYLGSVSAAAAWGEQVKSAFDLYRWDLLKKLGYTAAPENADTERELWTEISKRMIYGNPPADRPLTPYTHHPTPNAGPSGES
ncbi:MAG TPA: hypothetical protein VF647_09675 [Longimicrobium sp.]|jgi:hypothetical protein